MKKFGEPLLYITPYNPTKPLLYQTRIWTLWYVSLRLFPGFKKAKNTTELLLFDVRQYDSGWRRRKRRRTKPGPHAFMTPPSHPYRLPRIVWRGGTSLRLNDNLSFFTAAVHLAVTHIVMKIIRAYTAISSWGSNERRGG